MCVCENKLCTRKFWLPFFPLKKKVRKGIEKIRQYLLVHIYFIYILGTFF
jgi:hypothetical protein